MQQFISFIATFCFIPMAFFAVFTYQNFKQGNKAKGIKFLKFTGISFVLVMFFGFVTGLFENSIDSAQPNNAERITASADNDEKDQEQDKKGDDFKSKEEQPKIESKEKVDMNEKKEKKSKVESVEVKPLTKEEVLSKFEMDNDYPPYIDKPFIFKDESTDTADYYSLADTERYRNCSVIFKDGNIAKVKFIPLSGVKAEDISTEFGITDTPQKLSGAAGAYEVALVSKYQDSNIKLYPFELD